MSIFVTAEQEVEHDAAAAWEKIKHVFHDDFQPLFKKFLGQFGTKFGAQAVTASLEAVAEIPAIGFGPTAVNLATTLYADARADAASVAALDAAQVLQTIQSALQVAKVVNGITTPADQTAAKAIAEAEPSPGPAPEKAAA